MRFSSPECGGFRDDVVIVEADLGEQSEVLRELIEEADASGDWNAVADWCESIDWLDFLPGPRHEVWLDLAARAERVIEEPTEVSRGQIAEAVCWARDEGTSWERIGELLGTSAAEAQRRYEGPAARPSA